jgi:plastocyanin
MRTTAKLLLMMVSALVVVAPATPTAQAAGTEHATIANFSFSPNPVKIPVGTTLQWTNTDGTAHTVTADDNSFGSTSLAKDATFTHTFNQPGPVTYHCNIHPSMKGTVEVEATTTTAEPTTTTTAAPTTTTTATPTPTTTAPATSPTTAAPAAPKPTTPKPAPSSTTRATAAPTTTAPAPATTAPSVAAPTTDPSPTETTATASLPEQTAPPTEAALDTPTSESGDGGAVGLGIAIAAVVLLGGGVGWWAWRRRVSAG